MKTNLPSPKSISEKEWKSDLTPFEHGEEGTHYTCHEMWLVNSPTQCCGCNGHKCKPNQSNQVSTEERSLTLEEQRQEEARKEVFLEDIQKEVEEIVSDSPNQSTSASLSINDGMEWETLEIEVRTLLRTNYQMVDTLTIDRDAKNDAKQIIELFKAVVSQVVIPEATNKKLTELLRDNSTGEIFNQIREEAKASLIEEILKLASKSGACFAGCDRCEFSGSPDYEKFKSILNQTKSKI